MDSRTLCESGGPGIACAHVAGQQRVPSDSVRMSGPSTYPTTLPTYSTTSTQTLTHPLFHNSTDRSPTVAFSHSHSRPPTQPHAPNADVEGVGDRQHSVQPSGSKGPLRWCADASPSGFCEPSRQHAVLPSGSCEPSRSDDRLVLAGGSDDENSLMNHSAWRPFPLCLGVGDDSCSVDPSTVSAVAGPKECAVDVGVLLPPCALRVVGGAGAHSASSSQPEVPDLMEVGDEPFIEPSFGAVACTSGGGCMPSRPLLDSPVDCGGGVLEAALSLEQRDADVWRAAAALSLRRELSPEQIRCVGARAAEFLRSRCVEWGAVARLVLGGFVLEVALIRVCAHVLDVS